MELADVEVQRAFLQDIFVDVHYYRNSFYICLPLKCFFGFYFEGSLNAYHEQKHWFHPESPEIGEKVSTWVLQAAG